MFTTYDLSKFIFWSYWGTMLGIIAIAFLIIWLKQGQVRHKIVQSIACVVLIPVVFIWILMPSKAERKASQERKQRYETAKAIFEEQCKNAGEKIYKTVDNVEGIMLLKIVSEEDSFKDSDAYDPVWANAAFLSSGGGDGFVKIFLGHYGNGTGYSHIDVLAENQKDIIRYTGKRPLVKEKNPKNPARYAVTFEQNIDPELRKHWVAGGNIQIIDRKTNEIIAEKTSYVFEKGLGGRDGARMPWMFAVDCPNQPFVRPYPIFKFLISVVKPKQENKNAQ